MGGERFNKRRFRNGGEYRKDIMIWAIKEFEEYVKDRKTIIEAVKVAAEVEGSFSEVKLIKLVRTVLYESGYDSIPFRIGYYERGE